MNITRIERKDNQSIVFIPGLFGDEEVVVPRSESVFTPIGLPIRKRHGTELIGLVIDSNGSEIIVGILPHR